MNDETLSQLVNLLNAADGALMELGQRIPDLGDDEPNMDNPYNRAVAAVQSALTIFDS
jgi:hypothetical protein